MARYVMMLCEKAPGLKLGLYLNTPIVTSRLKLSLCVTSDLLKGLFIIKMFTAHKGITRMC